MYPFSGTKATLDIEGDHADYRVVILCDRIPDAAITTEATKLLKRLGEAFNKNEAARKFVPSTLCSEDMG